MCNNRQRYPPVYICSPYRDDTYNNIANAIRYCKQAIDQGYMPIATHLYFPRFLNDEDLVERELCLSFGLRLIDHCEAFWVCGDRVSEGMQHEIDYAQQNGIPIQYNEREVAHHE
ncbi:hypothetical protein AGMMS49992_19310 [Clostridia bacterium]|nr:hypothetical protein AGMMS49992_19310 [Clostridia bacterium]